MERVNELRSPIYLCLGDSEVGKSQLLSLLGCRTVTEKNKERFSVNIGFYFLHKFDIERIMQDYTIEDNSLHPGITLIEMPSSTTHTNRVRLLEMADFAILVISHLSSFASEMIELLCKSTTPFVTVLNKVDTMNQQQIEEVHEKLKELAPTQKIFNVSALKGEGEDMLQLLRVFVSQTFDKQYIGNKPKCTVVDVTEGLGHGALLLVVVVDGVLNAKDTIVVSSYEGPIVSSIKALWVPRGSKELLAEIGIGALCCSCVVLTCKSVLIMVWWFVITYSWAFGIVFIAVVNDFLGWYSSILGTVWNRSHLGAKKLSRSILMRWAVRDALTHMIGL